MTEMEARMDDGSVVYVSLGEKSGMWGITIAPPSIGATGVELTDEQMRTVLRLSNAILGNEDDRLELFRRVKTLEDENDEIREENARICEENDAMRAVEDHQFADVYFTLRQTLAIDEPGCKESVVDTVQGLIDDLTDARAALNALADLKVYKAKNGANERYRHVKPEVWARAFRILGRGKEIELGALKERGESAQEVEAFRDVKARLAAISRTARREISIMGDTGRSTKEHDRILTTLSLINRIALCSVPVPAEVQER